MAEQSNPFQKGSAGENAFRAAYERLKTQSNAERRDIGSNFSNAYQQLRQQNYAQGLGAAAQSGLSGGQAAGVRQSLSAQQMGALGNLMQGQERALREQKVGEASIYSNALLEGQQAQQYQQEQQQSGLVRQQTIDAILNNKDLTAEEKQRQLEEYGVDQQEAYTQSGQEERDMFGDVGGFSGFVGASISTTLTTINKLEGELENANLTTQERQAKQQEIIDNIEKQIRNLTSPGLRGGSITRAQAINRLRRAGLPVDAYGIR
jgi:hypothetical protein